MRKTVIALGATVCILAAEPLAFAVAVFFTTFHVVLSIATGKLLPPHPVPLPFAAARHMTRGVSGG